MSWPRPGGASPGTSSTAPRSRRHTAPRRPGAGTGSWTASRRRRCTRPTCTSTGPGIPSWPSGSLPGFARMPDYDLHHHGDREVEPGLVDLAVNVRLPRPPAWLRQELASALDTLAAYPSPAEAASAVAARHGRRSEEVLVTAGAAEAVTLLASALRPRHAVVVHPQFTEPEAALRTAGHAVSRVILSEEDGFVLDPALVPDDADLVFVGNPTNPTSVLHPAASLLELARPSRLLVVGEVSLDA